MLVGLIKLIELCLGGLIEFKTLIELQNYLMNYKMINLMK